MTKLNNDAVSVEDSVNKGETLKLVGPQSCPTLGHRTRPYTLPQFSDGMKLFLGGAVISCMILPSGRGQCVQKFSVISGNSWQTWRL